jgi:hypothetical protein
MMIDRDRLMAVLTNVAFWQAQWVLDLVNLGGREAVDKDLMGCIDILAGVAFSFWCLIGR